MDRKQGTIALIMIALTLVGMAGLYYGLWRVYQEYQAKTAPGTVGGTLTSLASVFGG